MVWRRCAPFMIAFRRSIHHSCIHLDHHHHEHPFIMNHHHHRGQQACLVCPEANEKECKNCKLIKKAETRNHHQITLGNHEFSGKRLEEKSEKGKRYHRKCKREFQKLSPIPTTKFESGKGEGAGKRESRKGGKEFIHFAATTSLTPREKE